MAWISTPCPGHMDPADLSWSIRGFDTLGTVDPAPGFNGMNLDAVVSGAPREPIYSSLEKVPNLSAVDLAVDLGSVDLNRLQEEAEAEAKAEYQNHENWAQNPQAWDPSEIPEENWPDRD